MTKICLLCFILVEILAIQVMGKDSESFGTNPSEINAENLDAVAGIANPPISKFNEGSIVEAEAPGIRRLGKHHTDKSVAGGGVIIGGLVTAIFAAVFCYIRVTGRNKGAETAQSHT